MWDEFRRTTRGLHDAFDWRDVTVERVTETYDTATGDDDVSVSELAESPIRAEVTRPDASPDAGRDVTGAESAVDAEVYVRDDTGIAWQSPDERPDRVTDTLTGVTYDVYEVSNEDNGLLRLDCIERVESDG